MEKNEVKLIIGYLNNTLTYQELNIFYEWLNDTQNKELFFEAKAIYDASTSNKKSFDIDASWQRLLDKKDKSRISLYSLNRHIMPYVAAVVAILITSAYFLYTTNDNVDFAVAQYAKGNDLTADKIMMSDGTQIRLATNSKLNYEKQYGKSSRSVLLEGEAYFEVNRQENKPFIVKLNGQEIEVLGTKFNVMAYPGDSIVTTTLLEGSVSLYTEATNTKNILKPGQQLIYNRNSNSSQIQNVDTKATISWLSGYYCFYEQPLVMILDRLSHVYNIQFFIHSDKLKNTIFTGTFYRGQDVNDIMEIINMSIPIKYKIDKNNISVSENRHKSI